MLANTSQLICGTCCLLQWEGRERARGEVETRDEKERLTNSNLILDSSRNDDVGYLPLWLDVALEVWLDEGKPLLDAAFDIASSFGDVS